MAGKLASEMNGPRPASRAENSSPPDRDRSPHVVIPTRELSEAGGICC
jgi:hypothetical protein